MPWPLRPRALGRPRAPGRVTLRCRCGAGSAAGAGSGNAALPAAGAQAIATAAARVAVYDSDRALELLDTLPSEGGRREDARTMASRLVFAMYLQHHGAAGAQTLLAHARKWGEHGGFPYEASAAALARLRQDEDAAEDFFRQELAVFARGQEGVFGVREFAGLLERAVALEAISDESAEEAGQAVVAQLGKLAGMEGAGAVCGAMRGTAPDRRWRGRERCGCGERRGCRAGGAADGRAEAAGDGGAERCAALGSEGLCQGERRIGRGCLRRRAGGAGTGNAALPAAGAGRVTLRCRPRCG